MEKSVAVSVLLPAYNEQERIYENSLEVSRTISSFENSYEIIIINDGSADATLSEAIRASKDDAHIKVLDQQPNLGKGWALRTGTAGASGKLIAFCDADLDIDPAQLKGFVDIMKKDNADAVIGSKMHRDSKVDYPLKRRILSFGYYIFLLIFFQLDTKDTQTGLKLFRADKLKPVMRRILVKRFAFDIEMLSILKRRGGKIVSAPVEIVFRRGPLGRLGLRDAWSMMWDTLAVFYRLKILKYYDKEPAE